MDTLSTKTLKELAQHQAAPCVSLYMTTHPMRMEGQQDPVRWRNQLRQVEKQLLDREMRGVDVRKLLQPADDLVADSAFWSERSHGLAAFISTDMFAPFRLPWQFDELAIVDERFHVRPLLPLMGAGQRCFILALSQNDTRLFVASRFQCREIAVNALQPSMKDALNYTSVDRGSQVHPAMKGSGALGKQAVVFHGHGGEWDTHKCDLEQFFRQVDAAIHPVLTAAPAPLLLAGVEYLLPIYREICSYRELAAEQLPGNCDHLTTSQLHSRAFPLMDSIWRRKREKAQKRYIDLAGTGLTSNDTARIVAAAYDGRIDVLFLDSRVQLWGNFCRDDRRTEVHATRQTHDSDLLELAATQTILNRGTVYAIDRDQLPSGSPVASVFRY